MKYIIAAVLFSFLCSHVWAVSQKITVNKKYTYADEDPDFNIPGCSFDVVSSLVLRDLLSLCEKKFPRSNVVLNKWKIGLDGCNGNGTAWCSAKHGSKKPGRTVISMVVTDDKPHMPFNQCSCGVKGNACKDEKGKLQISKAEKRCPEKLARVNSHSRKIAKLELKVACPYDMTLSKHVNDTVYFTTCKLKNYYKTHSEPVVVCQTFATGLCVKK